MWSHYALNHTGICIEFDISKANSILSKAHKVSYSNKLPHFKRNQNEDEIIISGLLNKTSDWNYEAEWRLIDTANKFYPIDDEILSVIVGARISKDDLEWVKYWIKDRPDVLLKKCTFSSREYKLDISDL